MKIITIKTSICVLFVGLSVFIEQRAQAQLEGGYATCNADTITAPTPTCNPPVASITWTTGTMHCNGNNGVNSVCVATTSTNCTQHTEPVSWTSYVTYNWASWQGPDGPPELVTLNAPSPSVVGGSGWEFPNYVPPGMCDICLGEGEGLGPANVPNQPFMAWLNYNYTVGADTQTTVSGPSCVEYALL